MTTYQNDLNSSAAPVNEREAKIDSDLGDIWAAENSLYDERKRISNSLARTAGFQKVYAGAKGDFYYRENLDDALAAVNAKLDDESIPPWDRDGILRQIARLDEIAAALASLREQAAPNEAIYAAEQWNRFFLVNNAGGHIHSSMRCSTCHVTTSFSWLPTLSGLSEKDAVDAHGAILCTVCFPSAPVEWTNAHEVAAEAKAAEKAKTSCPGSGTWDHDSSGLRYMSPRAKCNHCQQTTSVTSTGKLRSHKPKGA